MNRSEYDVETGSTIAGQLGAVMSATDKAIKEITDNGQALAGKHNELVDECERAHTYTQKHITRIYICVAVLAAWCIALGVMLWIR